MSVKQVVCAFATWAETLDQAYCCLEDYSQKEVGWVQGGTEYNMVF